MFQKIRDIAKDANFHWKDAVLIVFIGLALMLLTNHISDKFCN